MSELPPDSLDAPLLYDEFDPEDLLAEASFSLPKNDQNPLRMEQRRAKDKSPGTGRAKEKRGDIGGDTRAKQQLKEKRASNLELRGIVKYGLGYADRPKKNTPAGIPDPYNRRQMPVDQLVAKDQARQNKGPKEEHNNEVIELNSSVVRRNVPTHLDYPQYSATGGPDGRTFPRRRR